MGYRESKASCQELLLGLKRRGLHAGPLLAVGDGAMGFWPHWRKCFRQRATSAAGSIVPTSRLCRRGATMGNMLNALPKSQHGRANADLQAIWMAATHAGAYAALDRFVTICGQVSQGH